MTFGRGDRSRVCPLGGFTGLAGFLIGGVSNWRGVPQGFLIGGFLQGFTGFSRVSNWRGVPQGSPTGTNTKGTSPQGHFCASSNESAPANRVLGPFPRQHLEGMLELCASETYVSLEGWVPTQLTSCPGQAEFIKHIYT